MRLITLSLLMMSDLFQSPELLPKEVQDILNSYNVENDPYKENERILQLLKPYGYEFEYGLCGTPFNLKKIA